MGKRGAVHTYALYDQLYQMKRALSSSLCGSFVRRLLCVTFGILYWLRIGFAAGFYIRSILIVD